VAADEWLNQIIHQSPAFQAQVKEELAAIAQPESAQPKNVELRTPVRVATALGAHVDVSIRPRRQAERKSRQRVELKAKKPAAVRPASR
jgi:hypothetical protein